MHVENITSEEVTFVFDNLCTYDGLEKKLLTVLVPRHKMLQFQRDMQEIGQAGRDSAVRFKKMFPGLPC